MARLPFFWALCGWTGLAGSAGWYVLPPACTKAFDAPPSKDVSKAARTSFVRFWSSAVGRLGSLQNAIGDLRGFGRAVRVCVAWCHLGTRGRDLFCFWRSAFSSLGCSCQHSAWLLFQLAQQSALLRFIIVASRACNQCDQLASASLFPLLFACLPSLLCRAKIRNHSSRSHLFERPWTCSRSISRGA